MANKKYKLTDGNYWATDGVYDFDQGKTQREVNGDLIGAITSVEKGIAIIVDGDTCSTAVPSGGYAYIKNNTHGLTDGLYKNKTGSAFPTSGGTANSTVFEASPSGIANQVTPISLGGTGMTGKNTITDSSLSFNATYVSGHNLRLSYWGKLAIIQGWIQLSSVPPNNTELVTSGLLKSSDEVTITAFNQNDTTTCGFILKTSGKILAMALVDYSTHTGDYLNFNATYIIDN